MMLYHVKTQQDYDALMKELEEQGCEWFNSRDRPTELNVFDMYGNTVVSVTEDKSKPNQKLAHSSLSFYEKNYPNTPIIEYTAKEKEKVRDKEWLKKEINRPIMGQPGFEVGYWAAVDKVNKMINQLEEPEKVIIPQFVADDLEKSKGWHHDLLKAMNEHASEEVKDWIWRGYNSDLFARAWLDGYEVEKEKLYRIKLGEGQYAQRFNSSKIDKLLTDRELAAIFTEQEIKAIDPRYMAFAKPVEELEE